MDTVTILRRLWRFRLLVSVAALVAVLVGMFVSYKLPSMESRKYEVGVATARILVDTPASQVVDVAPKGSDSLGIRATLLSNLMVDGVVKSAIAKRAGIPEAKLYGVADSADGASPGAAKPDPRGYSLATKVLITAKGDSLPIIEVATQGPDARAAEKLANAAIEGLHDYLDSKAVADQVPDSQRLRVSGLGVPQAQLQVRGPRLIFSVVAVIFVFGLGCAAILMLSGLIHQLQSGASPVMRSRDAFIDPRDDLWDVEQDVPAVEEDELEPWVDSEPAFAPPAAANGNGNGNGEPVLPGADPSPAPPAKRSTSWWGGGPG
jgi:hypothetical protein